MQHCGVGRPTTCKQPAHGSASRSGRILRAIPASSLQFGGGKSPSRRPPFRVFSRRRTDRGSAESFRLTRSRQCVWQVQDDSSDGCSWAHVESRASENSSVGWAMPVSSIARLPPNSPAHHSSSRRRAVATPFPRASSTTYILLISTHRSSEVERKHPHPASSPSEEARTTRAFGSIAFSGESRCRLPG